MTDFALPPPKDRAIIFDLDDTLVDTFTSLITPLERKAAREMVAAGMREINSDRLFELILKLRREDPAGVERTVVNIFPDADGKPIDARRAVFTNASPDKLTIDPQVTRMLQDLSKRYDLYLVTTGPWQFQQRKIDLLGIANLFRDVVVLASDSEQRKEIWLASDSELRKEIWLKSLLSGHSRSKYHPGYDRRSVLVVGNRLDNEIQAGNKLGMITVWIKSGEGSGLVPNRETGLPTSTIETIYQFPATLAELESTGALH